MAAIQVLSGRDALRFTTFVPLLEETMASLESGLPGEHLEDMGTLPELIAKTEQLVQVALDQGQIDRVERLLALGARLASLRDQALQTYGEDIDQNNLRVSLKVSLPVPEPESQQAPQTESDCPICFDAFPTAEGRGLLQCGHLYCHQCLASHFETKIAENQVATEDLKCPDPSCTSTAASYELEALVSTASYARYCELITLASLRGTPGSAEGTMAWCPKSQCSEAILLGAEDTGDIECPTCKTHFCASCKATPYHTGKTCAEAKATPAAASSGKDAQFDNYMKHVGTRVKPCPQCGTAIEKNGGCNHIICVDCKYEWCWLCRREYHCVEYGHYNSDRCKGLQFCPVDSIEEVEAIRAKKKAFLGLTIGTLGLAAPLLIWFNKQHPNIE